MDNVLVTVLLPIYKDDGFFELALNSILSQSYNNLEILIIANNCSDELWGEIENYKKDDHRIKTHRLILGGLTFALNYGINIAQGKYIARMDADDISYIDRISMQVEYLEKNSDISLVGSRIRLIDQNGNPLSHQSRSKPLLYKDIVKDLSWTCPIAHPSVMFRREDIISIGGYKFGFYGEDYELWLRLVESGKKLENLPEILLDYRLHGNQLSGNGYNKNNSNALKSLIFYHILISGNWKLIKGFLFNTKLSSVFLKTYRFLKGLSK